ncbi:MAG: hypothetical protein J6S14_18115 [Clostridia bacterium]|nr:hypothetical protein [Clostridia bacterium]
MRKVTDYVIVISKDASENERRAAAFIRDNIRLVCGKIIPIINDSEEPCANEIVVGETTREQLDGVAFNRYRDAMSGGIWEYVIKAVGGRLYLTGLGCAPESEGAYTSAYKHLDDGKVGTVMAAYHFVEDILGYNFIYSTYIDIPVNPDIMIPDGYHYEFTREALRAKDPVLYEGAAFYTIHGAEELNCNMGGMIFKSKSGKIAVIDGGRIPDTDRFIRILQKISGREVPHVDSWLFSHLHCDHYGVYYTLCSDEKYRGKVTVGTFYCDLLTEEFYTKLSKEKVKNADIIRSAMMSPDSPTGAEVVTVKKGDIIAVDEIEFEVIHVPDMSMAEYMNMNDSSVVYKMTYDGKQTMMLLGDAEWVCSNDLTQNCADKLKSDIVQVGHHGCGNVSAECYELIDADVYIWPVGEKFWYSDCGEGLNTHNTGVIRSRAYMMRKNPNMKNVYVVMDDIMSSPLPMTIY